MAGKRAAAEVLAEWEQKMKEKAAQTGDAIQEATGTGGMVNEAKFAYKHPTLAKGKDMIGMGGVANTAGMNAANAVQGGKDIYDQVIGSQMGQSAQAIGSDIMTKIQQLPPQIQQQIQQAVQSGQVTMDQVAQQLQQMGGAAQQQAGNVMADPAYEAKLMQIQGTAMPARPGPYPDIGGLMTRNAEAINSNMYPPGMMQQPGGTGVMENQIISKLQEMGVPITPENVQMYMKMKAGAQGMMQKGMDSARGLLQ